MLLLLRNKNIKINKLTRYITGGEIVHKKLIEHNIKYVFGISGGANLPLLDPFYNNDTIKFITTANEGNAGHCAMGISKSSNICGVVIGTSGPGTTNLITALQDANSDGVALVAITGQVATNMIGTDAFQECDATNITKSVTKWNVLVDNINDLPDIMDKAFSIAMSGRKGAVHVDIPKNISSEHIKTAFNLNKEDLYSNTIISTTLLNKISNIAKLINNAKSPILYIGQGSKHASDEIRQLAILGNIPVTTTLHGVGIVSEESPLNLQMLGMHGNPAANYAIQNADVIIAIGARFDDRTTGNLNGYAPKAREAEKNGTGGIIHFDICDKQINKTVNTTYSLHGDCQPYLNILLQHIEYNPRVNWFNKVMGWKDIYPFSVKKMECNKINDQIVIQTINKYIKNNPNVYITTGVGIHQMHTAQHITWQYPGRLLTSGSLGVMGTCLPYSIGAHFANPDCMIIGIDGDGSFNMSHNDLITVARYNIPVKIAIMNNKKQYMVSVWQKLFCNNRIVATDLENPDYVQLGNAYGIKALRCDNLTDLDNIIEQFINYNGPIICDFDIVPTECWPLVPPGNNLGDMAFNIDDCNAIVEIPS
jgi:acetolactate synthase-1/2/3 large subunit